MQIDRLKLLDEIKNSCDFYYSGLFDKKKCYVRKNGAANSPERSELAA